MPDKVFCLATGEIYPCQMEVLTRRPSGGPDWVLVTACLPTPDTSQAMYEVLPVQDGDASSPVHGAQPRENCLLVPSQEKQSVPLLQWLTAGDAPRTVNAELQVVLMGGERLSPQQITCQQLVDGPVYEKWLLTGSLGRAGKLRFQWIVIHYKTGGFLKLETSIHNPRRAEHPGNYWDLGDPASLLITDVQIRFSGWSAGHNECWVRETLAGPWYQPRGKTWQLTQSNSGGVNWQSRAHQDVDGKVLQGRRGYQVSPDDPPRACEPLRATPQVRFVGAADAESNQDVLEASMTHFWEKFPNSVCLDGDGVLFSLGNTPPLELQGGEKTSRTVWLRSRRVAAADYQDDLSWVHRPLVCRPLTDDADKLDSMAWKRGVDRLPGLLQTDGGPYRTDESPPSLDVEQYLAGVLEGPENFFAKRETIDEYGWRNFGDFWADHEEFYSDDPRPVISHYNNQYDCLYGLLRQYIRTGKSEWWQLAAPLAEHIIDVDSYDTDQDRAAYNGGLFWHTAHYRDVFTSTHRTYSKQMTGDKHAVDGGGPSNEHNYASGLLLYYRLTGSLRAKRTVQKLADWVIAMDDGRQSVLAPLSPAATGLASSTSTTDYHGLGRGVGNSIHTLLDGWLLTQDRRYVEKCDQLIKRVIHPGDDVSGLQFENLELRWSYSVSLQAMVRYLDLIGDSPSEISAYLRESLLRYGRWMQENERLALDHPDELEFPTETWAAQDIRKGASMMLIASMERPENRDDMYAAGEQFARRAYEQLVRLESCWKTRPIAILLQQVPVLADAERRFYECDLPAETISRTEVGTAEWAPQQVFVSQKQQVKGSLRNPLTLVRTIGRAVRPGPWRWFLAETVLGAWYRSLKR